MTWESMWIEYRPVMEAVASDGGRRYHTYGADSDDFYQELSLWMWQHRDFLLEKKADLADQDGAFERFLARCLRNEVEDYGLDIKAQAGGQDRASAYWYTRGELENLIPNIYNRESWLSGPVSDGPKGPGNPAEGGNWIATLADVSRGVSQLDKGDREILSLFYERGLSDVVVGDLLGVPRTTASGRRSRAVTRLLKVLGGSRPSHMRDNDRYDPWRGRHPVGSNVA